MVGKDVCPQCAAQCEPHHRFCASCGSSLDSLRHDDTDPLIGTTLRGGYHVTQLIDVGGMGRVYQADQTSLGRAVAVKIIHPHLLGDKTVEARFVNEARAASRLHHPNSVSIIDFGKHDGRFFIVMELLRGRGLTTLLLEEAPLPARRAVDIACQALAALAEAHGHGIVHRDIKSENLVLEPLRTGGDFVKVLDFGLAQFRATLQAPGTSRITSPGIVCGTPEYMSPEQARGGLVDHRSDIYSTAVVLFELLTGTLPFSGDTLQEIVRQHMVEEPPDPRSLLAEDAADDAERRIPAPLVDVIMRSLSKKPEDRPQTAEELHALLRAAVTLNERPAEISCGSCGAPVPRRQQFCGHCGATMARKKLTQVPPPMTLSTPPELPLRGRDEELRWLYTMCSRATDSVVAALVTGVPGSGRTRLVTELLRERERLGDRVVSVGPDPWAASVQLHAAREAVLELADLRDVPVGEATFFGASVEARAGLQLLLGHADETSSAPELLVWQETAPYRPLSSEKRLFVAEALRWAVSLASTRNQARVILLVDDLPGIDGASRNAFIDLLKTPPTGSMLLVGVAPSGYAADWEAAEAIELAGLPEDDAWDIIESLGDFDGSGLAGFDAATADSGRVTPLHLEQLLRFAAEGGGTPPAKASTLVATRVALLPADARRVLQAIALFGDLTSTARLVSLLPDVTTLGDCLARLRERRWIESRGNEHMIEHPWLRELIAISTPPAVREELHSRSLHDFGDKTLDLPLEARALHAYHAGDTTEALSLLERVAARCADLGNLDGRVAALSRALDVARRNLTHGDGEDRLAKMLVLAGKLADALIAVDRSTHAVGVLREALELAPPNAPERPRLLASLALATHEQGQFSSAIEQLDQALASARLGQHELLSESLEQMLARWSA